MLSIRDQENLANAHQTTAAGKPLNQSLRNLQSRTPGINSKTPFRARNDENRSIDTGKAAQNVFATPAPRTRAPLGAKTTNAKARAFQTPAQLDKNKDGLHSSKRSSLTRRSARKNALVLQENTTKENIQPSIEDDDEPESGYAPPPIIPLPDPPLEFDYDTTYACLRPENFTRGVGEIYFQSPKDEDGFSLSSKREEAAFKKSLEDDLDKILQTPLVEFPNPDEKVAKILKKDLRAMTGRAASREKIRVGETKVNTIQARTAASKLSGLVGSARPKLPVAVDRETASSKQKRKSTFLVSRDSDNLPNNTRLPLSSKQTIGFPKAKKTPSILPKGDLTAAEECKVSNEETVNARTERTPDQSQISPRKFLALYGEPPVESEMWFRLKELEIRDRRREDLDREDDLPQGDLLFALDEDMDTQLDDKLAVMFETEDADDFEL